MTIFPGNRALWTTVDLQLLWRLTLKMALTFTGFGLVLLVAAGTIRYWNAWAFLGLSLTIISVNLLYLLPRNPEIITARGQRHSGTKGFDKLLLPAYGLAYVAILLVAGLDAGRFDWAPLSWPWSILGAVLLVASMIPISGAMAVNRHLEPTVRIQSDRDHHAVTTGPYRFVRHPMYVGTIMQLPATALLLGSGWAFAPALVCFGLIIARTLLEDRTLRRELPGYADFATKTRYRLLPGVW